MDRLIKKFIWILPTVVILIGISVLFYENHQKVTEPPNENWSREVELGLTSSTLEPIVNERENGHLDVSYLMETGVKQISLNESLEITNENTYDIPYDKWTQFFLKGDHLIYSDYYAMYDGKTDEKISEISKFIPLQDQILYQNEVEIMRLNPETQEPSILLTLENDQSEVDVFENQEKTYLLSQNNQGKNTQLTFYDITSNEALEIGSSEFNIKDSEVIEDINFSVQSQNYSLVLTTYQKQSMSGSPTNHYYYASASLNEDPNFNQLSVNDPKGTGNLTEISDIHLKPHDDRQTKMIFKAFGSSETLYRSTSESNISNIYELTFSGSNILDVSRLSNTPNLSTSPSIVNENTITWIDIKGETNRLLLASSNKKVIEQANKMSIDYFLNTLGKTLGMLSYSFFAFIVGFLWFIWPLVFILIVMLKRGRELDRDRSWIFFAGVAIYIAAAFQFKDRIFTPELMARAPGYLSFLFSPYIFIFAFALLTYGILSISEKKLDWSITLKLTYFVIIHLLFITIFFGPYLL
ncbi:hypothetical protein [Halobacillus seohaensis]|uniref:DUF5050 domain-containing protein n=1 Tax=Halobacillus seohaensis TaxID=447421 RepID=A0ABW2ERU1_9BACI